jgi:hypothetical protein
MIYVSQKLIDRLIKEAVMQPANRCTRVRAVSLLYGVRFLLALFLYLRRWTRVAG